MAEVSPFKENSTANNLAIDFDSWLMNMGELLTLYSKLQISLTDRMRDHTCMRFCTCSACGWRAWVPCRSMHLQNTAVDGWHELRFICTYCSLSIRGEKVSQTCHSVITMRVFKAYDTDSHQTFVMWTEVHWHHSCHAHTRFVQLDRLACYFWTLDWIKSIYWVLTALDCLTRSLQKSAWWHEH